MWIAVSFVPSADCFTSLATTRTFVSRAIPRATARPARTIALFSKYDDDNDDDDDDAWDCDENNSDASSSSSKQNLGGIPNLGINMQLEPLTAAQAADLKREATETINAAFDECLEEIERMKLQVKKEITLLTNEFCTLYAIHSTRDIELLDEDTRHLSGKIYYLKRTSKGILSASPFPNGMCETTSIEIDTSSTEFILFVKDLPDTAADYFVDRNDFADNSAPIGTKLLLEDDFVKIWEFKLDSGHSCPFHCHCLPYLFLNLAVSRTQTLLIDGNADGSQPKMQEKDQVTFVRSEFLGKHGVRNVGEFVFQQFIVEMKR